MSMESPSPDPKANKAVVRAFVDAINRRDWTALDAVVAAGFVRHSHAAGRPRVRSRDELKTFLRRELEVFPDASETIQVMLAEGDKVAARIAFRGTQAGPLGAFPASGKTLLSHSVCIFRLERGRVAEAWAEWDNLSALAQLGHWEPID
jgi:steroid delta-isomerase-like uncharacterized protein